MNHLLERVMPACLLLALALCLLAGPLGAPSDAAEPLPSWNSTQTRGAIVDFVRRVTDPQDADFVAPENRVAVFDNDGTLWCEKPLSIHFYASLQRMREQLTMDPALAEEQPYETVAAGNMDFFDSLSAEGERGESFASMMAVPFGGLSATEYAAWMSAWFEAWRHPRFKVSVAGLVFQPMLELIGYLEDNGFTVHIVTGDEDSFVRLVATQLYGLPPEQVLGSSVRHNFITLAAEPMLVRSYSMGYINDGAGKPRSIRRDLGRLPILAAGNSDGDLQMLQYVTGQERASLGILVRHTDAQREYAYDTGNRKVREKAGELGWTVIDIEKDWERVFVDAK